MKNNKNDYDYGKCHICGEQMQEKRIKQDFWLKGKLMVIESVPAGVCPQCGEKVVRADVGRQLARLIENPRRISKRETISVPVIEYVKDNPAFLFQHESSLAEDPNIQRLLENSELLDSLALGLRSREDREMFWLMRQGLALTDIAKEFNETVAATKLRRTRVIYHLRKQIAKLTQPRRRRVS